MVYAQPSRTRPRLQVWLRATRWCLVATLLGFCLFQAPVWGDPIVLVIDPGHGDRQVGSVPADPGTSAATPHGRACECVFTWDTAMRLKTLAEAHGCQVFLTLEDPQHDYLPKAWGPDQFPSPDGPEPFVFKTLVEVPRPQSVETALLSRVMTGNRIYHQCGSQGHVFFVSLHFDSTSPRLQGVSLYYPPGEPPALATALEDNLRQAGRARIDMDTDQEYNLAQPHDYAILIHSDNPEARLA